jgi:hypothetical protein
VYANRKPTGASVDLVARESALTPPVKPPARIECQRMGGDDGAARQHGE